MGNFERVSKSMVASASAAPQHFREAAGAAAAVDGGAGSFAAVSHALGAWLLGVAREYGLPVVMLLVQIFAMLLLLRLVVHVWRRTSGRQ